MCVSWWGVNHLGWVGHISHGHQPLAERLIGVVVRRWRVLRHRHNVLHIQIRFAAQTKRTILMIFVMSDVTGDSLFREVEDALEFA